MEGGIEPRLLGRIEATEERITGKRARSAITPHADGSRGEAPSSITVSSNSMSMCHVYISSLFNRPCRCPSKARCYFVISAYLTFYRPTESDFSGYGSD